jgi:hypothetical protein
MDQLVPEQRRGDNSYSWASNLDVPKVTALHGVEITTGVADWRPIPPRRIM